MDSTTIPSLLITANVGSIFEDPSEMLKLWTQEFLLTVAKLDPKFIALHCQEVGGKNYENSMKHVENFVKLLMSSNELRLFDKVRVFLDEDYSSAENFTALGNLYFVHKSVENVLIWDFNEVKFVPVQGKEIHSGNIEAVVTKEKAKFPQDFFPECKWSRKGFLRTRWSLNNTVLDLINIHLFHDASNFVAMESYPSVYCKNRRRALEHTLQRFHNDSYGKVPYFLFGDFNFRTDTDGVIKKLTEGLETTRLQNNKNKDHTKLQYVGEEERLVLTVGKKEFSHLDHQTVFLTPTSTWLKSYDKELEAFDNHLTEYPITFPPSYPFEEKISHAKNYMQTRCPAWCDRVLLSHTAKQLIKEDDFTEYSLMGMETCMGDHKPVYLKVKIKENSGTVKCCNHAPYECLPATCRCCQSFASVTINVVDMSDYLTNTGKNSYHTNKNVLIDSKLLHEPIPRNMLTHEPYTPESCESHTPLADEISTKNDDDDDDDKNDTNESGETPKGIPVSPSQLKVRLENILKFERKSPKAITRSASENVEIIQSIDSFFRNRAMSETPKIKRVRLISTMSAASSVHRFQSHHSSSDEEWFEFDNESNESDRNCQENVPDFEEAQSIRKVVESADFDLNEQKILEHHHNNHHHHCDQKKKLICCCVM